MSVVAAKTVGTKAEQGLLHLILGMSQMLEGRSAVTVDLFTK